MKKDIVIIEAKNVYKTYTRGFLKKHRVNALKDVSLSINRGELFGILGPNGAGKTTFMNILIGLIIPDSGEITIDGNKIGQEYNMEIKKKMNMCSGNPNLPWSLSVIEILRFYSMLYNINGKQAENKIEKIMKEIELEKYANTRFDELSTGNKQKLSLAKSLINDPEILLLDEPTLGLDPHIAAKTRVFIKKIQKEKGITVLLTTHYMQEAEELCDRLAFIKDGRIIGIGTKKEMKKKTKTKNMEEMFIELANQQN